MKMRNIIILLAVLIGFSACKDLTELNVDKKRPTKVSASSLFSQAEKSLVDQMVSANVNRNTFRLWAEYWAETQYPDESNFELTRRNINGNLWNRMYVSVIGNLREAKKLNDENPFYSDDQKRTQDAMADILEVYAWHVLVDVFGAVPYQGAFTDELTPKYDSGDVIYNDIATRLDNAIAALGNDSGLGGADLIYGGDMAKWKKFANSLKLRMAIRIADVDPAKAKTMAEAAFNAGVILDNADNFSLQYQSQPPNTNPIWVDLVQSGRTDFIAANTIVDYLNNLNDPRVGAYFEDNLGPNTYTGGIFGTANNYAVFSHVNPAIKVPSFPGTLLDAAEVHFLLADAAERGFSVGGTAAEHYEAAIRSSFEKWGLSSADADTYLAQPDVAYDTAPGTWKEKIGLQKWIAMFNRGFEGWTTYRLYDAPAMNKAADTDKLPPSRWIFPNSEYSLNEANVKAAGDAMGGDSENSKVFWDVN